MMSFCVVPLSADELDAVLLGHRAVEAQEPGGGGVDRHRRVHLAQRDAVEQRVHVALVGDRDADLADLAARELGVGVVAGLGGQVEGDREPRLALGEVPAIELVRAAGVRMTGVGAHHPRAIRLGQAVLGHTEILGCPAMANVIDCMHLGRDRVIGAWEVRPGVIVDPGPASCAHTLLAGRRVRAAGAAPVPHPPRPRRRLRRARAAVPGAARLRARGRRAARDRPVPAPGERRAPLRRRDGAPVGGGGAGARGARHRAARAGRRSRGSRCTTRPATRATTSSTSTAESRDAYTGDVAGLPGPAVGPRRGADAAAGDRGRGLARVDRDAPLARARPASA